ncbi:MAG: 50S ribosomal protein L11 methyltransferase [Acidobacteria bacterium]|nr:50S ribosomal protein L11 methyltransferase [Acidobacteriota bacterium]
MTVPKPDKWNAVSVTVAPEYLEAAEFAFNELDSLGSEIDLLSEKDSELRTVTAYFNVSPSDEDVRAELERACRMYSLAADIDFAVRQTVIEDRDWLAEWKKYWKPVQIGRFVIAAPWHEVPETDVVIRIEPNMAFGTGTHATTQLCLEAIDKIYRPGQTFFDVGTGTGILAIAAAKLSSGNEKILAVDTDPDSIAIARENAAMNGAGDRIEFGVGSIDESTDNFDFVCANLTADVILPILPQLIAKTNRTLVLSGILAEQEKTILLQIPSTFAPMVARSGEWISVLLGKRV